MAVKVELPQDFKVDEVKIENIRIGAEMRKVASEWMRPFIYVILPTEAKAAVLIDYRKLDDEYVVDVFYDDLNDAIRKTTLRDGKGTYQLEFDDKFEKRIKETISDILSAYHIKKTTIGI